MSCHTTLGDRRFKLPVLCFVRKSQLRRTAWCGRCGGRFTCGRNVSGAGFERRPEISLAQETIQTVLKGDLYAFAGVTAPDAFAFRETGDRDHDFLSWGERGVESSSAANAKGERKHSRGECSAKRRISFRSEFWSSRGTTLNRDAGSTESRQGDPPRIRSNRFITAATGFGVEDELPRLADEQPHHGKIVSTERSRRLELVPVPVGALDRHLVVRDSPSVNFRRVGENADGDAASAKDLRGLHCTRSGSGLFGVGHTKKGVGDSFAESVDETDPARVWWSCDFSSCDRDLGSHTLSLLRTIREVEANDQQQRSSQDTPRSPNWQNGGAERTARRPGKHSKGSVRRSKGDRSPEKGIGKSGGAVRGSSPFDQ